MTRQCRLLLVCLVVLTTSVVGDTHADWMNLTGAETAPNIAEITIEDDRVRVALESYVGDLEVFEALIPDELLKGAKLDRPELAERMKRFSEEHPAGDRAGFERAVSGARVTVDTYPGPVHVEWEP